MFINLHTHQNLEPKHCSIRNISDGFENISGSGTFSAGIHPWYIKINTFKIKIAQLETVIKKENVLAVGECGLDKACKTDLQLQEDCFLKQIRLANFYEKPLIIHCVKAFAETVQILEREKCGVPVIFHGFNKGIELAEQLISRGHYLSFGKHLFESKTSSVFQSLPLASIFLETDVAVIAIEDIYQKAAAIRKTTIELISNQIEFNARAIFSQRLFLQPS